MRHAFWQIMQVASTTSLAWRCSSLTVSSGSAVSGRDTPGREGCGFFGFSLPLSPLDRPPPRESCEGGVWELREALRGFASFTSSVAIRTISASIWAA